MQRSLGLALLTAPAVAAASDSPVGKVLSMLSDLQQKVIREGEVAQKEYAEFAEWCQDQSRNLGFELKTGASDTERLKAKISKETATVGSLNTKVEEASASLATNEADLKAATWIRSNEAADFAAEQRELSETVSMLERATAILEREMNKGGSALVQLKNAANMGELFDVMVRASMIGSQDGSKLTAFVQDQQKTQDTDDDSDEAPDAPEGSVYKSQSGGIVDTLQDLQEKAESLLADLRKRETVSAQHFALIKQSLESEIKYANNDLDDAKKGIAVSNEKKANAKGDLDVTTKNKIEDTKARGVLHQDCMNRALAFEAETKSRAEELKALAAAKEIIKEGTQGEAGADAAASFMQVAAKSKMKSKTGSRARGPRNEIVRLVRDLGRTHHSMALVQLAGKLSAAMKSGDAFEKVKGLISDMITKLEDQAGADATKKAYCDKELAETKEKKDDKNEEIEKITTKIDQMSAKSAQLKQEVAALQNTLVTLAQSQAKMDQLRHEENAAYKVSKADLEKGLTAVKAALKLLSDYYAQDEKDHDEAQGAASGIIGLLEVIEADFSKNLAEVMGDEDIAVVNYEKVTDENGIEKTVKVQDVRYKVAMSKQLDKTSAELKGDRTGVRSELEAVMDYLSKVKEECIAKAETYDERKKRREAEVAGLKEALATLEDETAFLQRSTARRTLRGGGILSTLSAGA